MRWSFNAIIDFPVLTLTAPFAGKWLLRTGIRGGKASVTLARAWESLFAVLGVERSRGMAGVKALWGGEGGPKAANKLARLRAETGATSCSDEPRLTFPSWHSKWVWSCHFDEDTRTSCLLQKVWAALVRPKLQLPERAYFGRTEIARRPA